MKKEELKEKTELVNKFFPFNIFSQNHDSTFKKILSLHWHDNMEFIYLTEGNAIFDIGGNAITAFPGDIIFVNSGELHSGYSINNTDIQFHAIVFNKSLLAKDITSPFYNRYITPFIENQVLLPSRITKDHEGYRVLKMYIETILDEFNKKEPGYEIMIPNAIYSILVLMIRHYHSLLRDNVKRQDYNKENFQTLFEHISQNYSERITVKQAAAIVNLSPYYFCRLFKKLTGRTFTEFLNLHRVDEAEKLLRTTNISVTEIAYKTGFCNINYFDKVFKEIKRYSPTDCRKNRF